MPHFCFIFTLPQAGCVERLCLFTPWATPQQVQGPNGVVMATPEQLAFNYIVQQAQTRDGYGNPLLPLPPGSPVDVRKTNPTGAGKEPVIYCTQVAYPAADRVQTNAPYADAVGQRGLAPPPMQMPANAPRMVPQGAYEPLTDAGLGVIGDSMMGDQDETQRTFTDIDSLGNETVRGLYAVPGPPVAGRS